MDGFKYVNSTTTVKHTNLLFVFYSPVTSLSLYIHGGHTHTLGTFAAPNIVRDLPANINITHGLHVNPKPYTMNPFTVLGLTAPCSLKDVRKAYHDLARTNHPDKAGAASIEAFQQIQAAYDKIVTGKLYDSSASAAPNNDCRTASQQPERSDSCSEQTISQPEPASTAGHSRQQSQQHTQQTYFGEQRRSYISQSWHTFISQQQTSGQAQRAAEEAQRASLPRTTTWYIDIHSVREGISSYCKGIQEYLTFSDLCAFFAPHELTAFRTRIERMLDVIMSYGACHAPADKHYNLGIAIGFVLHQIKSFEMMFGVTTSPDSHQVMIVMCNLFGRLSEAAHAGVLYGLSVAHSPGQVGLILGPEGVPVFW